MFHGCAHRLDPRGLPKDYLRATRAVRGFRGADVVIAYSSYVFEHLRRNAVRRLARVPLFITPPASVREPSGSFSVVFIGHLTATKGLGTLIEAMANVPGDLHVYGDGWWCSRGERLTARNALTSRVHFHGWTPPSEVPVAMR